MDIPWGSDESKKFVTNVGLVTSHGPHGPNIMACEWTHHVSYSPGLIAICLGPGKATLDNIQSTKEFGVNLAAVDQSVMSSLSGNYSGRFHDKINALKAMGFSFFHAKKIKVLMVKDAALHIECKLVKEIKLGDHTMLIGEALAVSHSPDKSPLVLHGGLYWELTNSIPKPSNEERQSMQKIMEDSKKQ